MSHDPRPAQLMSDPYWHAAFAILEDPAFDNDRRVWDHVHYDHPELGPPIDYKRILAEGTWSGGERRALEAAASLWNGGTFKVGLSDLITVGDGLWASITEAIEIQRDGVR